MKTKYLLLTLLAVAVLAGGIYFLRGNTSPAPVAVNKTVNFGAVLALTGYASNEGNALKNGTELAKMMLAKEGITMNVEYYDDNTDPKKSIAGVQLMHCAGEGIQSPGKQHDRSAAGSVDIGIG